MMVMMVIDRSDDGDGGRVVEHRSPVQSRDAIFAERRSFKRARKEGSGE